MASSFRRAVTGRGDERRRGVVGRTVERRPQLPPLAGELAHRAPRDPERLVHGGLPARADAERDPAPGLRLQAGHGAGDDERVAHPEDDRRCAQRARRAESAVESCADEDAEVRERVAALPDVRVTRRHAGEVPDPQTGGQAVADRRAHQVTLGGGVGIGADRQEQVDAGRHGGQTAG